MYGGTQKLMRYLLLKGGLSPRVRGHPSLCRIVSDCGVQGLSPRVRGHRPLALPPEQASSGVYPRVYGGTDRASPRKPYRCGLSPRVRGHRIVGPEFWRSGRSIPACTGAPPLTLTAGLKQPVYPRVYGGTPMRFHSAVVTSGLSPRVRGHPQAAGAGEQTDGSIPACTGEPS